MALPKAVQKQVDDANKIAEQIAKDRKDQLAAGSPPPESQASSGDTGQQAPQGQQAAAAEGADTASASPASASEGWEQKYKVLQGKYNAEVPRLQRQSNEMASRLEQLTNQLTATQSMLASFGQNRAAAPAADTTAPAGNGKLVKDEEVKEFGEELTDFIRRVAQDAVLPHIAKQVQPVKQQIDQVERTAAGMVQRDARTAHERFYATLDAEVPEWKTQNEDVGFLEWLQQADPYSGNKRADLLKQASERYDGPRVVMFFKGYRNENAVVTPPASAAPASAPAAGSQRSLDSFVAPGTQTAGATGAQNGARKRIWTTADIKQFYDDAAAGRYRQKMDERNSIEREIFEAQREGRIR